MINRFFSSRNEPPKKRPELNIEITSLMWPGDRPKDKPKKPSRWQADLGLSDLAHAMTHNSRYKAFIHETLAALITDPQIIEWRQSVLNDFANNPQLIDEFTEILPKLANLTTNNALFGNRRRSPLAQTSERLAELEVYVEAVDKIYHALKGATLTSDALTRLTHNLGEAIENEDFQALRAQLPELRRPMERITSLTIGINLDAQLRPLSAVLLAVNDYKIGGTASFLDRVIGPTQDEMGENGIAPLNYLPKDPEIRPYDPMFQDLEKLMEHVAKPVAQELARYMRVSSRPLIHLEFEIAYYLSAVQLMNRLQNNDIPLCFPEIQPKTARAFIAKRLYNINLSLHQPDKCVPSDCRYDDSGRIAILTGPNSGGKTTYLQAVGLAQAMAQAGLPIPAQNAQISPVASILTHFPQLETRHQGRLAEEAERLRTVFQQVSADALVLLNETFSSTSAGEALYLAQDMLSGLRAIGARAVFATHLVELAEHIDAIHSHIDGDSKLFSLVAGIKINDEGEAVRTFEIKPGIPMGRSYAQEIARRHGISLEQILAAQRENSTTSEEKSG